MPDRLGFAPVPGTTLNYEVTGSGDAVVFLHGFGLDLRMWDDQVATFANRYTVVRYDLRGFGKSSPSHAPYSHAGDLAMLLNHLGLTHASLVGLSMGGGAAINFALAHPSATRAIVAVDSTLSGFHWSKAFHDAQSVVYSNARTIGVDSARDAWLKLPIFRTAMANPRSAPRMKQMVGDYSGWHWLNPDPGVPVKPLAIDRLREIRARTLAMVGADDEPDFHAIADILASDVPGARKLELAGAGHMPPLERPDEFNAAVLEFLSR